MTVPVYYDIEIYTLIKHSKNSMSNLIRGPSYILWLWIVASVFIHCLASTSLAQEDIEIENLYHWAYSATFGTGYYRVGVDRVFVLRINPSFPLGVTEDKKNKFLS